MSKQYWIDSLKEVLEDYNIEPTTQLLFDIYQIRLLESEVCGYDNIEDPIKLENKKLKAKLESECNKVSCNECNGTGRINEVYGSLHCNSPCIKCNGLGKIFYWEKE